jgi:hypothetical protein
LWGAGAALLSLLAVPAVSRRLRRRRRLRVAAGPDAAAGAGAAWDEVVADADDYRIPLSDTHSPRTAVTRLTTERRLPEPAIVGLRLVALAEERARYARTAGIEGDLPAAVDAVRRGFAGLAGWRVRVLARVAPPSSLRAVTVAVARARYYLGNLLPTVADLPRRVRLPRLRHAQR